MQENRLLRMLGLAMRAKKLAFGEGAVRDSIRTGVSQMVIVSKDASSNTKKKFSDNCIYYSVPYFEYSDRYILGSTTGKGFAVVISVNDKGFAKELIDILNN